MNRQSIDSKHLASCGHDPATGEMEIEFRDGRVYKYAAVPQNLFDKMMGAKKPSEFFRKTIKGSKIKFERIK